MRRSAPRGRTIGLCIENPLRRQYPGTGDERGSSGPVRALLLSLLEKGHILLTSSEILVELARVLRYPRLQALFGLTEEQIYNYVQFLREVSQPVIPDYTLRVSIRDPQDIVVFQTAP